MSGLRFSALCLLAGTAMLLAGACFAADPGFSAGALRGVARVEVHVEGVPDDFARYGLQAAELRQRVRDRLTGVGLTVLEDAAAADDDASRLTVRLHTNQDPYGLYSYSLALRLARKLPLPAGSGAFISDTVWSQGRNGVINPTDLRRMYGYVDELLDAFLAAHGRDNTAVSTTSP